MSLGVCTFGGIYEKGPRSSRFFAFFKYVNIYVCGDGNTTCILVRNFYQKGDNSSKLIFMTTKDRSLLTMMFVQIF